MKNVTYINAGAGSGKTYRLTETLTELIKDGKVKPDQVILTTFTVKAANEFKEKAKAFLFDQGLFNEALQLDHAMIGTVHSVCQRLIGKYWFNLGLSPNMGVMAEEDSKYYISQSLAELPTEEELKLLNEFAEWFDIRETDGVKPKYTINYNFWQDHLKSIIDFATNYELDDFAESEKESLAFIRQFVNNNDDFNFTEEYLKAVIDEHLAFLCNRPQSATNDGRIEKIRQARRRLHKPTLGTLKDIDSTIGTPKGYGPKADEFHNQMAYLWTSQAVYDRQERYIKLLFKLAARWRDNFAQFKQEKNLLDYNDMEKYMRQLMQNDSVSAEISQSYRYLFVDEFQDSSPIQVKIFDALSDLMEHSYWVGDYKQAIYGFRGSDIALTKAVVDRAAKEENGCDTDTLDTSWRSLPDIVDVDNAVFEKTFASVLEKKNIHLERHRENENNEKSLRYFVESEDAGIAEHVLRLLNEGAKPDEIAVLGRTNDELTNVANRLRALNIPASREDLPVTETLIYQLMVSLLRIIDSSKDSISKATVALLTESDCTTQQIIEAKILNDYDDNAKSEEYLVDVPLISRLLKIRPRLQQQSVASVIETITIELNLYDEVKKIDQDPSFSISCLQTIINTARVYEEHCVQMNLPATIDGFIAYIGEVAPTGSGDPNGVQLHTYHSCKGLQWKYVILTSLNKDVADRKGAIKKEIYGVHAIHTEEPSVKSPYPSVYIRLTPWVYGTAQKVPDEINTTIDQSVDFQLAYQARLAEANRIFYVGMTRPQDVLLLHIKPDSKLLKWPKDIGVDTIAGEIPESGNWDVFGTGQKFLNFTLTAAEIDSLGLYTEDNEKSLFALNISEPSFEAREPRFLSPSRIRTKGKVASHHDFGKRIPFAKSVSDMSVVGDCIHQIFAGIEESRSQSQPIAESIASYGLADVLTDKDSIVQAWNQLAEYLTATYGAVVKTYHERPFRLDLDGQTVVGSIDLVWQTTRGDILIDFKTCPMGIEAILNTESEHYAGWYAGQLDAYTNALESAGEKVVKRFIYYPVSGLLVEVGKEII